MAVDAVGALATVAAIIGLGFLGHLLFERTRISDVLLLIVFGFLIGPVFNWFDVEALKAASPLVGALALIVLLFDGGLSLRLREVLRGIARATALALFGFLFTVAAVAAVGHYGLGLSWPVAILLGSILGGTSGVVAPMIRHTTAAPATTRLLDAERALTDLLTVTAAVALIAVMGGSGGVFGPGELSAAVRATAGQFSIAIVLGLVAGLAWLRILRPLEARRYSYMVTLAAILALFVGAQAVQGNGAIAVLVFGVVLGNGSAILRKFGMEGAQLSEPNRKFQGEITFLVRVFFFVYLGVVLDPTLLTDPWVLAQGAAVLLAILLARAAAVGLATWRDETTRPDRLLVTLLQPRGLAAAVLAGIPAQVGIAGSGAFLTIAILVIVATNAIGTGAVWSYELRKRRPWERIPVQVPQALRIGRRRA